MKKFYTDLSNVDLNLFFKKNTSHPQKYFVIYHMFFYMCLLPKKIKLNILSILDEETRNAFSKILNIDEEFCSTIEECDYVLLPPTTVYNDHNYILKNFRSQIISARKNNKKIIFFLSCDNDGHFNVPSNLGYVFRSSGFLSKSAYNVYGLPTINSDVFKENFASKKLSISFCGNYFTSSDERKLAIDKLIREMRENCDFILRDLWFGDVTGKNYKINKNLELLNYSNIINNNKTPSPDELKLEGRLHYYHLRLEYFKSLSNNLYCLCVRGGGNFSFRLGETFMMGRIPILIDTDCILPFKDAIPYDKNCVRIPFEDLNNAVDIIKQYHESHSEEELINIQKQNRHIWEEYFSPDNAFVKIKNIINKFNG